MFDYISTGAYVIYSYIHTESHNIAIYDIKCVGIEDSLFDCSINIFGDFPWCYFSAAKLICRSKSVCLNVRRHRILLYVLIN